MECELDRLQVPQSQGYAVFEVWHLSSASGEVAAPKHSLPLTQVASERAVGLVGPFPLFFHQVPVSQQMLLDGESTYGFGFLLYASWCWLWVWVPVVKKLVRAMSLDSCCIEAGVGYRFGFLFWVWVPIV